MITAAKFKGLNGATWYYGGVYNYGVDTFIIDKDGGHKVYCLFESIGATDKNGAEIYEDDLIAVVKEYTDARYEDGEWCEYKHKELILFRVERTRFGFKAVEVRGGKPYEEYGLGWVASEGKVVGNFYDCEDVGELYEKLEKEIIEND